MYHFTFEELTRFQQFVRCLGFVKKEEDLYRAENLLEYFPREEVIECFSIAARKRIFSVSYVVGILNKREEQRMEAIKFSDGTSYADRIRKIVQEGEKLERSREDERLENLGMTRDELEGF